MRWLFVLACAWILWEQASYYQRSADGRIIAEDVWPWRRVEAFETRSACTRAASRRATTESATIVRLQCWPVGVER